MVDDDLVGWRDLRMVVGMMSVVIRIKEGMIGRTWWHWGRGMMMVGWGIDIRLFLTCQCYIISFRVLRFLRFLRFDYT